MPKVTMKLSAKERKQGLDLRNYTVVPIKGGANRRRMGGAAMLVRKPEPERVKNTFAPKSEKKPKMVKQTPPTFLVTTNDIAAIEDELKEWDTTASLDVDKTFSDIDEAKKRAINGAAGSNVDFVVYEVREIYRAKRGI
jgi:hypothetical protein